MKKLIITIGLILSTLSLSAMEWVDYEILCFKYGKEPTYKEWEYLCTIGATDYGYDNDDLIKLLEEKE